MREIKFRGQRVDNKELVYGFVVRTNKKSYICYDVIDGPIHIKSQKESLEITNKVAEVIPETVGQFIGKKDKNGKEIYEGDIVNATITSNRGVEFISIGNIKYHNEKCSFQVFLKNREMSLSSNDEIIGNKFKNSELLK